MHITKPKRIVILYSFSLLRRDLTRFKTNTIPTSIVNRKEIKGKSVLQLQHSNYSYHSAVRRKQIIIPSLMKGPDCSTNCENCNYQAVHDKIYEPS